MHYERWYIRIGALSLIYGSYCAPLLVIELSELCEAAVRILNDEPYMFRRRARDLSPSL